MADKMNPIRSMLGHVAMGIGGGLTGHDYLGSFYKWKTEQEEKEKTDWEEEYYKSAALGEGYEPPAGGVIPSREAAVMAPPIEPGVDRALPSLVQGAPEAFRAYQQRPQLRPEFGAMGKKFAGYGDVEMKEFATKLGVSAAQQKKETATLSDKYGQTGRILQGLRNLTGYGKAMDEMNIPNWQRQAWSKGRSVIPWTGSKKQEELSPLLNYIAQQEETKIGTLPIISGQARYVVDLARAVEKTIPEPGLTQEVREGLISQSVRNMMTLVYGIENGYFEAGNLVKMGIDPNSQMGMAGEKLPVQAQALLRAVQLSPEQEKNIEEAIDYVLDVPKIKGGKLQKESKEDLEYKEYLKIVGGE